MITIIYNETKIEALFQQSLKEAKKLLASLLVYNNNEPKFTGLSGWVFEQTIQYCTRRELKKIGRHVEIEENVGLDGHAKVDLLVGSTAIEIKTSGLFSKYDSAKYKKYKSQANKKGWRYIFLSRGESYASYRTSIIKALGRDNVIFLDEASEWKHYIRIIVDGLKKCSI